jgi:hypothetical protein
MIVTVYFNGNAKFSAPEIKYAATPLSLPSPTVIGFP